MNRHFQIGIVIIAWSIIYSFAIPKDNTCVIEGKIKWYSWQEAMKANKKAPKKLMVDIYTDWCHWCKVMEKNTFNADQVASYINENFYPIKLNAEEKETIKWQGRKFKYVEAGKKGVHSLAYSLLDGNLSYPSTVLLTENFERIGVFKGYKQVDEMLITLKFAADEVYKKEAWGDYAKAAKPKKEK